MILRCRRNGTRKLTVIAGRRYSREVRTRGQFIRPRYVILALLMLNTHAINIVNGRPAEHASNTATHSPQAKSPQAHGEPFRNYTTFGEKSDSGVFFPEKDVPATRARYVTQRQDGQFHGRPAITLSLVQTACLFSLASRGVAASFTEEFRDRIRPIFPHGEREIAAGFDPDLLRNRWSQVINTYGIPRPIDLATFFIYRPPSRSHPLEPLHLDIARFDGPYSLPGEVEAHWLDLQTTQWRVHQGHPSLRNARTEDVDGWHLILLTERERSATLFSSGYIEVVSRYYEDEHSAIFCATLPQSATWAHIWNRMRLGSLFSLDNVYQVFLNGEALDSIDVALSFYHGFFLQIV